MQEHAANEAWRQFTVVVLLTLTYVVALRVGGELSRLPTPALLGLVALNIYWVRLKLSTLVLVLGFVALALLHLVVLDSTGTIPFSLSDVLPDLALYAGLIGAYVLVFSDVRWQELERVMVPFFKLMILIALGFWGLARLTGSSIGVDISYDVPRLQGLMTEPSNTAHFLPAMFLYSWGRRDWVWLGVCGVAIVLTFSPTVMLTLALTVLALRVLAARAWHLLLAGLLMAAAVSLIVANFKELIDALNELGQPGQALARILEGFNFIFSAGEVGANSRAELMFAGVDFMNENDLWWSGAGFATSAFIGDQFNGGLLFDTNTWFSLIMWFGVLSIPLSVAIQYLAVRRRQNGFTYLLLVSLCVSNTVNAGGIWVQMFFATMLCLKIKHDLGVSRARVPSAFDGSMPAAVT